MQVENVLKCKQHAPRIHYSPQAACTCNVCTLQTKGIVHVTLSCYYLAYLYAAYVCAIQPLLAS